MPGTRPTKTRRPSSAKQKQLEPESTLHNRITLDSPPLFEEIVPAIPPVDDLTGVLESAGGRTRFLHGDCGESRMTAHLWQAILELGVDEETAAMVRQAGIAPPTMRGPLPTRAGLALMRAGVFHAVQITPGTGAKRWIAGTVLAGGHADRLLAEDLEFTDGGAAQIVRAFACEGSRDRTRARAGSRQFEARIDLIALPSIRAALASEGQFQIWTRIARICQRFAPAASSLREAYAAAGIATVLGEETPRHLAAVGGKGVQGVVLKHGGEVIAADLFASSETFQAFAPGIVRSYLVEAMLREDAHSTAGAEILAASSTAGKKALARLLARQQQGHHLDRWHTFLAMA